MSESLTLRVEEHMLHVTIAALRARIAELNADLATLEAAIIHMRRDERCHAHTHISKKVETCIP